MLFISKVLSIIILVSLSTSLFSKDLNITTNEEYFNNLYEVLSEKENGRINIKCDDCGIENNHPDLQYIFKDYDKLSTITYLKDGISVSYSKETFVENMKHLYMLNKDFNEGTSIRLKTRNLSNDYINLDGKKYLISELEKLIKRHKTNKANKEVSRAIENIESEDYILNTDYKVIFQYKIRLATFYTENQANDFISKFFKNDTSVEFKKSGKYIIVQSNIKSTKEKIDNILSNYKNIIEDAYIVSMIKINDIKLDKKIVEKVKNILVESNSFHYEFVITSSSNLKDVDKILSTYNDFGEIIVKQDKISKYYMGVVILENDKSLDYNLNKIKKIVKDAWLLKSFKIN